jgi:hypothetical protein
MKFWGGIFLLGAGLNILLGLHGWPAVLGGSLDDPDSYMRLERIRQGIAQGHLVNIVARDDAGAGVLVEWSRLLDMLIWTMATPLAPFLGWTRALFIAGVALGPLGVGVLAVSLAFAARPFAEDGLLWTAALGAAVLPGLLTFAAPGVVHYHILLLALIAASNGYAILAWRSDNWHGFLAGIWGGFAIWMTPETMPFVLMGFVPLLLRWLQKPVGVMVAACAAGFFDVIGFGLMVDPPQGGYKVIEIDRLSLVYLVLGFFLLLGGAGLWRLQRWNNLPWRRAAGVALMGGLLLLWIMLFPGVILGPYGLMSPQEMRQFFGVMAELQPLRGPAELAQFLLPGALAMGYALWRAVRDQAWQWAYLALCILVALVLGARFILFVGFSAAAAAALVPVMLSEVSQRYRAAPSRAMLARLAVLAAMLVLPELPGLAKHAAAVPPAAKAAPSCSLRHIAPLLADASGQVVLAEAQNTPELLYRTGVLTVGSLYQHGLPAYFRARAAWRSVPGAAPPPAVTATGAKFILFCPAGGRYPVVRDLPKTTLWDTLAANQPPPWLSLVGQDSGTGWRLYRITP